MIYDFYFFVMVVYESLVCSEQLNWALYFRKKMSCRIFSSSSGTRAASKRFGNAFSVATLWIKSSQVKLSFIVIPLRVWTYSGTKCHASQDHGATWIQTYTTNLLSEMTIHMLYIKWLPIHKLKNTNWTIVQMPRKYCTCEKHSSSWLGNSAQWFEVHEHVNIHILLSLLWNLCTHSNVWKCLVWIEESVLLQVVCTGPLTCVYHALNNPIFFFFQWCGKVGESMFQEVGDLYGVS